MGQDPYAARTLNTKYPCADKSPVIGGLCCVLHARAEQRGLELVQFPSRAMAKYEIHELILTAEEAGPGKIVNEISYLGYFEVLDGGVIWVGDQVYIGDRKVGTLAGYDMTHSPNHMNIIIRTDEALYTGFEAGFKPGAPVSFIFPGRPAEE